MKLPSPAGLVGPVQTQPTGGDYNPIGTDQLLRQASRDFEGLSREGAAMLAQQHQHEAVADASKRIAQARLDMTGELLKQRDSAEPGAPNFTPSFLQTFDEYSAKTLENAPEMTRPYLERHLDNLRSTLGDHALAFESNQALAKRQQDLTDTINLQANVVRTDDTQYPHALGEAVGAIHGAGIRGDQAVKAEAHVRGLLAQSLIEGLNDRDPKAAKTALEGGAYDADLLPQIKNALLERNNSILDRQQKESDALFRGDIKERYANEVAAIRDRGYGTGLLSNGMIAKAFPEQAPDLIKNLADEHDFYQARQQVLLSSPAEDTALLAKYKPEGGDYALQAGRRDALAKAISAKWQLASKDPVGYLVQSSPALRQAFDAAGKDAAQLPKALELSDQLQSRIGLPDWAHSTLTGDQAKDLVGKISTVPPDQAGQMMSGLQQTYGDRWPKAFEDLVAAKLPTGYQVLGSVQDPAARTQLTEALRAGPKTLKEVIGPEAHKEITKSLDDVLGPFTRTLAAAPNGADLGDAWRSATELLAMRYVNLGTAPPEALRRAAGELAFDKYDIAQGGSWNARVPKGTLAPMQDYAGQVLGGLKSDDVQIPPRAAGEVPMTDAQRAKAYFRDGVQSGAQWVTNPRDDGLMLLDAARQPVTRQDGTPVGFSFDQALRAQAAAAAAARAAVENTGLETGLQP